MLPRELGRCSELLNGFQEAWLDLGPWISETVPPGLALDPTVQLF